MHKYFLSFVFSILLSGTVIFDVHAQYSNGYYGAGDYNGVQDIVAPVISSVTSALTSINAASITWTTDESATSQVEYGLTTSYNASTTYNVSLVTSHSVSVTSLATSTTYHYRVISKDSSNNTSTSSDYTFTTTDNVAVVDNSSMTTPGSFSSSGSNIVLVRQMNEQRLINSIQRDLVVGSNGEDVRAIQNFLISRGYLLSGNNTGFFGNKTKAAIKKYQQQMNIYPVTGNLGPLTRAALKIDQMKYFPIQPLILPINLAATSTVYTFKRDLAFGAIDDDVKSLQKFLNANKFIVSATGPGSIGFETNYFGPNTKKALMKFQEKFGIKSSGDLNLETRTKINIYK